MQTAEWNCGLVPEAESAGAAPSRGESIPGTGLGQAPSLSSEMLQDTQAAAWGWLLTPRANRPLGGIRLIIRAMREKPDRHRDRS